MSALLPRQVFRSLRRATRDAVPRPCKPLKRLDLNFALSKISLISLFQNQFAPRQPVTPVYVERGLPSDYASMMQRLRCYSNGNINSSYLFDKVSASIKSPILYAASDAFLYRFPCILSIIFLIKGSAHSHKSSAELS